MSRANLLLAVLALALFASQASAETRSILIQVMKAAGDKTEVTIHSQEKKDRRDKASVAEAAKAIAAAEGWGSIVNVYVTADKGVKAADLKKVLDAAKGNHWCKLHPVGDVPQRIREVFASLTPSDDDDPEPPAKDQAKRLRQIAGTMDDLARCLKDGSLGEETQKLQERVQAQLGEALKREKAVKREKERLQVAPGIEQVRAMQERIARDVKRLAQLGGRDKERAASLSELSEYQAKAAQMLRDAAAKCGPAR